ncbi:hypothetical protein EI94DRAFT_492649 [Lactarius quietus]|nr:hypothetical protein EI94DRAFT_492649 [Lactarius quietus]
MMDLLLAPIHQRPLHLHCVICLYKGGFHTECVESEDPATTSTDTPTTSSSAVPPAMTQSHVLRIPSPTRDPSSTSSGSRQPDVLVSTSVQIPASPSVLNGASGASSASSPSTGTTPSSRREPLPQPPPVDDAESWPEVGKSQISAGKSQRVSNGYTGPVEVKDVEEKDTDELSPSHPGTPRKGDKTKWIVIPPEELQATADSLNPPRSYAQSRSHSQLSAQNSQTRNAAASGSGSMQSSQVPSKTALVGHLPPILELIAQVVRHPAHSILDVVGSFS